MALKPKSTNTAKNVTNPTTNMGTPVITKTNTTKMTKKTTNGNVALKTKPKTITKKTTSLKKTVAPKNTKNLTGTYVWPANTPQVLPFFHLKFERYASGIKLYLTSTSPEAASTIQKYFQYYTGSMASVNIMQNGIPWFSFNFAFGNWNWKSWDKGVCYVCNTTDKNYVKALHSFVELANNSLKYGSTFSFYIGGNPICCAFI
jgi:hypothetical protein